MNDRIDIIYLAKGRCTFTEMSFGALVVNTNWGRARLVIYTDGDDFQPFGVFGQKFSQIPFVISKKRHGGPVAIMNHFLGIRPGQPMAGGPGVHRIFAKIDNDVMVPPGWLDRALAVMDSRPELDLLGLEPPSSTINVELNSASPLVGYSNTDSGWRRRLISVAAPSRVANRMRYRIRSMAASTDWQLKRPWM